MIIFFVFFFFFQAEDGIRDVAVTGVQTCALPICPKRSALPGISLSTDTSILTALGNDYGYEKIFSRQIEALGCAGDIAIGISTSGNSPNVIEAAGVTRSKGLFTVGFTGETGGKLKDHVEVLFSVPSRQIPRIQETHLLLGHIICDLIDRA